MSDREAQQVVRSAFDAGVNLFDTADMYGDPPGTSEKRLGSAIEGFRDQVYVVTKLGHWGEQTTYEVSIETPDMVRLCAHASLGRLGTDYVDLLLCHDGNIEDPAPYIDGFEQLQEEGCIREYGISTGDYDILRKFYEESGGGCAAVEVDYSLLNRSPEEEILPFCEENGLAVLARGPLAKGLLTGKYDRTTTFTDTIRSEWNRGGNQREEFLEKLSTVERIKEELSADQDLVTSALSYVTAHDVSPVVIPGATTPEQAVHNAAAGRHSMDDKFRAKLGKV